MQNENEIELSPEQKEKLKEYFKEEWFKELNRDLYMYLEEADEATKIYHITQYIKHYCMESSSSDIKESVEHFFILLDAYEHKEPIEPKTDEDGLIRLIESGFNSGNGFYTGKIRVRKNANKGGAFTEGVYVTPDRKRYIKKIAMDSMGKRHEYPHHEQSKYNAIVAHEVFDFLGEQSAKYLTGIKKFPYYYVISENFLDKNQELITFEDLYQFEEGKNYKQSEVLELMEKNIEIRYKNQLSEAEYIKLLNKLKLQYAKQAFIKRLIGIRDENLGNIALMLTTNGQEAIPQIDMSPAFDFDISFKFGEELEMYQIPTENGQTDIKSLMQELFKIEGFKEFIESIMPKLNKEGIEIIMDNAYKNSQVKYLEQGEGRQDYIDFMDERFNDIKTAYNELCRIGGIKDDARTILD